MLERRLNKTFSADYGYYHFVCFLGKDTDEKLFFRSTNDFWQPDGARAYVEIGPHLTLLADAPSALYQKCLQPLRALCEFREMLR